MLFKNEMFYADNDKKIHVIMKCQFTIRLDEE